MKLEHVADRAAGYGMPGVRVDGNDPLAVASALDEALGRARSGDGPTFIECVTFRFRGHYFGDRMPYIPKEQLAAAMAADPVPRFRRHLVDSRHLHRRRAERHRRRRAIDRGSSTEDRHGRRGPVDRGARPRRVRNPDQVPGLRTTHMDEKEMTMREALQPRARPGAGGRRPSVPARRGHRRSRARPARRQGCRRSTATTASWTPRSRRPRSSVRPSAPRSTACCRWPRS